MRRAGLAAVRGGAPARRRRRHAIGARRLRPGGRHRQPVQGSRSRLSRPSRQGTRPARPAADGGGPGAPRRGDDRGDRRRVVADRRRGGVLQRDDACHDLFDLRRAQEWTTALERWCAAQPGLVPFRGYCQIRRSELLQIHGAWPEALAEARRACGRLTARPAEIEAGPAYYQLGELHRLRGDFAEADDAYRRASRPDRKPYPGLALLRLARARPTRRTRRSVSRSRSTSGRRADALRAAVDIMLRAADVTGAREAAAELARIAETSMCRFRARSRHRRRVPWRCTRRAGSALRGPRQAPASRGRSWTRPTISPRCAC